MTAEIKAITLLLVITSSNLSFAQSCPTSINNNNGMGDLTLFFDASSTPDNLSTITLDLDITAENVPVQRFDNSYQTDGMDFSNVGLTGDITLIYDDMTTLLCNYDGGIFNSPTPVDLVDWNGILKSEDVKLNWSTAWEENNAGFEIERSFDGQRFEIIGMVEGIGNSELENHYSYIDKDIKIRALGENVYYRLVQIDYDGTRTLSKVIAIDLELDYSDFEITKVAQVGIGERRISVNYYNPPNVRKINILVTNIRGNILFQSSIYPSSGINSIDLNLKNDPGHLIFLSMDNGRKLIQEKILLIGQQ